MKKSMNEDDLKHEKDTKKEIYPTNEDDLRISNT